MLEQAKSLLEETKNFSAKSMEEVEAFRIKVLGSKGELKKLFAEFKSIPNEDKKEYGAVLNQLKEAAQEKVNELKVSLADVVSSADDKMDLSRPVNTELGSRHPISIVKNQDRKSVV